MTCFWDGVLRSLDSHDFTLLGIHKTPNKYTCIASLIESCKSRIQSHTPDIKWQNAPLHKNEIKEIREAIREYNSKHIRNGHFTSSCDPFLCFLSSYLSHKIVFQYMNHTIVFLPPKPKKEVHYRATRGHFTFVKTNPIKT